MLLITGAKGQLGQCFQDLLTAKEALFTDADELNITDKDAVLGFNQPLSGIINCAAYTNVDKAEDEQALAAKINVQGPQNLSLLAQKQNIPLIHISTDYVYDGKSNTPITENAQTVPLGVYGRTKLEGEQEALRFAPTALIIRTAWLYSPYGKNFVKTMLSLGKTKEQINVVYDQVGTPTYAPHLAQAILNILPQIKPGTKQIYHFSNEGVCSWYDFAWYVLSKAGSKCKINPILSKEYPTKATRPAYSVLSKNKIKTDFKLNIPHWITGAEQCLKKLV